jgi:predicted nucleotidyltransferase
MALLQSSLVYRHPHDPVKPKVFHVGGATGSSKGAPKKGCSDGVPGLTNPPILGTIVPEMGAIMSTRCCSALFGKTRRAVLGLLFSHPDQSFYVRQVVQAVGTGQGAVQRELNRLARADIITREVRGNQVHYRANPQSPIFNELQGLIRKTVGLADVLRAALAPLASEIKIAFVYGSQADGTARGSSDVDLLVVGEVDDLALHQAVMKAEERLGRTVNYTLLDPKEFKRRRRKKGEFLNRVLQRKKIFIVGEDKNV